MGVEASPFVHLFQTERHKYAYDVNSNDVILLTDAGHDILLLLAYGMKKDEIVEKLEHKYGTQGLSDTISEIESLQQAGRAFRSNRPATIASKCLHCIQEDFECYIQQLTLEITQRCNLACKYCSYSGIYDANRCHNSKDMDWETARAGLELILEHGGAEANIFLDRPKDSRDFALGFYGGEPLLRLDLVSRCVKYVMKKLERGRKCHFTITTNGMLLGLTEAKELLDNNVAINISLDGPPDVHNRFRIYPDGSGTHSRALNAIKCVQEYAAELKPSIPIYCGLIAVIVGDVDYRDLWEYFVSLEDLLNTPHATFVVNINSMSEGVQRWNDSYPEEYLPAATGFDELVNEYVRACVAGVYAVPGKPVEWRYSVLQSMVMRSAYFDVYCRKRYMLENDPVIPNAMFTGGICTPGLRRMYMTADGSILPCERVPTSNPYYRIGTASDGIDFTAIKRLMDDYIEPTKDDCRSCWAVRFCNVGCIKDMEKNGKVDGNLKHSLCERARGVRHKELIELYSILEQNPAAFDHYKEVTVS